MNEVAINYDTFESIKHVDEKCLGTFCRRRQDDKVR